MNILFVCSANKIRSVTAENHFRKIKPEHTYDSAGTNEKICKQSGTTLLSIEQAEWAETILKINQKFFEKSLQFSK